MDETTKSNSLECCVVACARPLDREYWDGQYKSGSTGWDLGQVSPPLRVMIDGIKDKSAAILIPGAGNAYETEYLLNAGFTNITIIDIAPTVVAALRSRLGERASQVKIIEGDFFEHEGAYRYILEQTFMCALPPALRPLYVYKMYSLLVNGGMLIGVLFDRDFEKSPPFGGSRQEYGALFAAAFDVLSMETCLFSAAPRAGTEVQIILRKAERVSVSIYEFEGITCNSCKNSLIEAFAALPSVLNARISSDFDWLLIVSAGEALSQADLDAVIAYEPRYRLSPRKG